MEIMALGVLAIGLIAALNVVGPRLGVAPQIILVAAGAGLSFLPGTGLLALNPQFVMMGLLPLLLYASSLALPTIEFRRDLSAIGGLSMVLVIITAIALGWLIHWLMPDIPLPIGVALGALLSPTDAAAIGIVKKLGLSPRVVAILDGEALLNDASALVMLRAGLAAVATGFSFWGVAKSFVFAVAAAALIGYVVGRLGVAIRSRLGDTATATAVSLLIPFVAYLPADLVGASGLVAVVAAGITTRLLAPQHINATQRMTETTNWHTIEFLAEGVVFLTMGAQVKGLVESLAHSGETMTKALVVALLAWLATLAIRGLYISGIVAATARSTARKQAARDLWNDRRRHFARLRGSHSSGQRAKARQYALDHPEAFAKRFERVRDFIRRYAADVDYLVREPLRGREGVLLTWAGLRGVVTVAGAQTLPLDLPHRPLIVLIAFTVAAGSLLCQGLSLSWLAKRLGLTGRDTTGPDETAQLEAALAQAARAALDDPALRRADGSRYNPVLLETAKAGLAHNAPTPADDDAAMRAQVHELRLAIINAKRQALLKIRSLGEYTSATVQRALSRLDADEISVSLEEPEA